MKGTTTMTYKTLQTLTRLMIEADIRSAEGPEMDVFLRMRDDLEAVIGPVLAARPDLDSFMETAVVSAMASIA